MLCITRNFYFILAMGSYHHFYQQGSMVHFGKTKIEEMCECQYIYLHAIYINLKEVLHTTLFFLYTVLHYF